MIISQRVLCLCLLLVSCGVWTNIVHSAEDKKTQEDSVIHDQWFNGYFDKQPAINAHEQIILHADGTRSTSFETTIAMSRSLLGFESTLKIVQRRKFIEDDTGMIQGFIFEDEENGKRTSAIGKIEGKTITATISKPHASNQQTLIIPEDVELMGTLRSQEYLNKNSKKIGDTLSFTGVEMMSGKITFISMKAECMQLHANGDKTFKITMDILPMFPVTTIINSKGHTREVSMPMGFVTINIRSAKGPMKLEAAKLDITKMIQTDGKIPHAGDNAYRINKTSMQHISADPFQEQKGDVLSVRNTSQKSELNTAGTTRFLASELQLELDNPALRAWVKKINDAHTDDSIAMRAEILRQSVRTHITTKDLSQGDASALETFISRRGDCTEHANLLCAALRIAEIPARSEVGFVFAPNMKSWIGHAWVSAYDSDQQQWIHLDAAYPGIQRSNYIKTASASGDSTGKAMARGMGALLGQKIIILDRTKK